MNTIAQIEFVKTQIEVSKARAAYWTAQAVTGAYKNRKLFHIKEGREVPFTDEENLAEVLSITNRHIERMNCLAESLYDLLDR